MEGDSDSNLIGGDAVADDGWFDGDSGPVHFRRIVFLEWRRLGSLSAMLYHSVEVEEEDRASLYQNYHHQNKIFF